MKDEGFTLIELLVVVTIIGILASIAIPQFKEYRARAYDAQAQSDLRNAAVAEEAYFLDYESYSTAVEDLPGFVQSRGVSLRIARADGEQWAAVSYHEKGTKTFCFDSAVPSPMTSALGQDAACL